MKEKLTVLLFLIVSISLFSQEVMDRKIRFNERVYDPFFTVIIKDNEGEKFKISRLAFFDEFNEKKFFFWVRRNSALYTLSFKNIKSIKFDEDDLADTKYKNFTRCQLELVTGENYLVYLKTTGHMEGFDEGFGSPVTFYMHYNLIESIEFNHEGEYYYCPFCETIYLGTDLDHCLYDNTPLEKGVVAKSEK